MTKCTFSMRDVCSVRRAAFSFQDFYCIEENKIQSFETHEVFSIVGYVLQKYRKVVSGRQDTEKLVFNKTGNVRKT